MAVVLSVCVLLFTVPAWQPIVSGRPISMAALRPILTLTLSSLFQIVLIALVAKQILPLNYSIKFAALGIPLCIFSIVLAEKHTGSDRRRGTVICSILGLIMWIFLITVH
jgi:hypothetical protein